MNKAIDIINLCEQDEPKTPATPSQAKKIVAEFLKSKNLSNKITAKTIGFSDLARGSMVFVTVHDWSPSSLADELKQLGKESGFRVDFKGSGFVG